MAKTIDKNGNTIQNEKNIKLTKNNLKTINVFNDYENYETNGMSLAEYGFSYENFYRVQNFGMEKRSLWISHWDYTPPYGGTFVLDYSRFKNITTKRIDAKFNWWYDGYYRGGPSFSVDIIYKDGTIQNKEAIWNGTCYLANIGAVNNEIDKIKFHLNLIVQIMVHHGER